MRAFKSLTGILLVLALALAGQATVLAGEKGISAGEAKKPGYKGHKNKHGKKTRVVVVKQRPRMVPAHPRRAYVPYSRPRTVVVAAAPVTTVAVVPEETVVSRPYYRRPPTQKSEDKMLGVGIRLLGATTEGEYLNLAAVENPTMWGLGLQLRGKVSPRIGLEFGVDYLSGDGGEMVQTTIPIMLSVMYHFFPRAVIRPHVLAGAGIHLTKLEYDNGFRYDTVQVAGQLGGGLELKLSDEFALSADLRFLGLYKNLGSQNSIERECIQATGNLASCSGAGGTINTDDQFSMGAQFMVGANLYF